MIAIIDYGMGNLRSALRGIEKVGGEARLIQSPSEMIGASAIVLPGDGAFGHAMKNLREANWIAPIKQAIADGVPFLGICVGMQLLFETSEESRDIAALAQNDKSFPEQATMAREEQHEGLGIFPGSVIRFPNGLKIPQMGWNQLNIRQTNPLLRDVPNGGYTYFVHSYYCAPSDDSVTLASTDYGVEFASIVGRDNVWGTQFHPEKSQSVGLKILTNFIDIVNGATR
jgi:imidazole glycerol-phosphate synthase subunit HisH